GAVARLAMELDHAAMQFVQSFRQRQAATDAAMSAGEPGIELSERLPCDWYLVDRHTDSSIFDPKRKSLVGMPRHLEPDSAARIGEFDRIGQQIDEDLGEFGRIAEPLG